MIKYFKITQFWLCIIATTYLSVSTSGGSMAIISDKIVHLVGYCLLFLSCNIAYPREKPWLKILFVFGFSLLMEIIQYFVPNRLFSLIDIIANLFGIALGCLLLLVFHRFSR
jgi:VanZ family protein